MSDWRFFTNHGRTMLFVGRNPDARLRDIAAALNITERTAHGIMSDLTRRGYVVKERDGRRNRYQVQSHLPLPDEMAEVGTVGEVLDLLTVGEPPAGTRSH